MDAYMAATAKNQAKSTECRPRLKTEEIAQVRNDFRQNNAQINQMSFIPVYSNKTVCHKFPKSKIDRENVHKSPSPERKVLSTYSPPTRSRCIPGNNDMIASRFAKTHIRRRSVGFEDMTSLSCYGHNFTNDRRFQGSVHNSNIPQSSTENQTIFFKSGNVLPTGKSSQSENSCFSSLNQNAELSTGENANDQLHQKTERPLQRYKDKSSKRKSSLNRIDFIQFPSPNSGTSPFHSDLSQQKNSSDEECESRFQARKSESPSSTTKRKHNGNNSNHATSKLEMKTNELILRNSSPSKIKSNLLPRSSQMSHSNPKQTRWKPSTIRFSQKLSHSAGELESLTDLTEVPSRNKTYLSAQECDDHEYLRISFTARNSSKLTAENIQKTSTQVSGNDNEATTKTENCDNASHVDDKNESVCDTEFQEHKNLSDSVPLNNDNPKSADQKEDINSEIQQEQIEITSEPNDSNLKLDCDDEMQTNAIKLKNLEISDSSSKSTDAYLSADENGEAVFSDGERRPSSILRKKSFEDKKELHSILKQPPEDKSSKTPPSILKHRESSEEKETWQPNDLHSILKKSTSEDESCNSGPDIRPILKLSTDEDSPSGIMRPRPILKKRTSFSDECSYVSFPSGELKPILKKKTPLSCEEQPKPILKSRRKSEDTRSTMSEVITSRPRAYSADMGVKLSHDSQIDNLEIKKNDFHKLDSHDL